MPRITLFGFYNYDPTLFDGIQLPTGCDPQILKDTIIMECGDLYTYYQHPGYLKLNINSWFRRMLPQFQRSFDALTIEYAPNENYDRYEDWEDSGEDSKKLTNDREQKTVSESSNSNESSTTTEASNSNETSTTSEASGTREDKTSAYNAGTYTPKAYTESGNNDESTTTGSASTTEETTTTGSGSSDEESTTTGKDESEESGTRSGKHSGRIHGNIGVTTNATLIREELELRRYDIYLDIARQFQKRFIVEVY